MRIHYLLLTLATIQLTTCASGNKSKLSLQEKYKIFIHAVQHGKEGIVKDCIQRGFDPKLKVLMRRVVLHTTSIHCNTNVPYTTRTIEQYTTTAKQVALKIPNKQKQLSMLKALGINTPK